MNHNFHNSPYIHCLLTNVIMQKYYYWLPQHDSQVRRNFDIRGAKQLKNIFSYARKTGKMPKFISPDNLEKLKLYWESEDFKKLSATGKANRKSDVHGVGPSLHTCGAIPMTEWCRCFISINIAFRVIFLINYINDNH